MTPTIIVKPTVLIGTIGEINKAENPIESVIAQRRVAFPEAELSLKDILGVYFSTLREHLKFILLSKSQRFKSAFVLNGLDVSDILLAEWSKSYWGYQQFSKLQAISHSKFFEKFRLLFF